MQSNLQLFRQLPVKANVQLRLLPPENYSVVDQRDQLRKRGSSAAGYPHHKINQFYNPFPQIFEAPICTQVTPLLDDFHCHQDEHVAPIEMYQKHCE